MRSTRYALIVVLAVLSVTYAYAGFWDTTILDNSIVSGTSSGHPESSAPGVDYGLRSVALSPNQGYVYAGFMHGGGIRYIYEYSVSQTSESNNNYVARFTFNNISVPSTDPSYDNSTQIVALAATNSYIYAGLSQEYTGVGLQGFAVVDANLTGSTDYKVSLSLPVYGLTVDGNYLYVTEDAKNGASADVQRYTLNPSTGLPTLDTSWGSGGTLNLQTLAGGSGAGDLRGVVTDDAGNIYIASRTDGKIYKINAAGTSVTSTSFTMPMVDDLAIYDGSLYATEYNGTSSAIEKVSLDLAVGITVAGPAHLYDGVYSNDAAGWNDQGGYSGLDISATGRIYMGDQYWNDTLIDGTGTAYFTDRLYGSDPLPEPGTLALFGLGIPALVGVLRRRRSAEGGAGGGE
jgi:hypothetical protein